LEEDSKRMKLYTSEDEYHELAAISQKGRSKNVSLPRKMVRKMILDHGRMAAKLAVLNVSIEPGKPDE
jgi:hypothetical protein